jgi:hypothetical protein
MQATPHAYEASIDLAVLPPEIRDEVQGWFSQSAPAAHSELFSIAKNWAAEPSPAQTRKEVVVKAKVSPRTEIDLEERGVLFSYLDGRKRLISTDSLYRHLAQRIIKSHPISGERDRELRRLEARRAKEAGSMSSA